MLGEFFRGFIKIHILHHAESGPVYGLQMIEELKRHGYSSVSPGTLYPTLRSLEHTGYLTSENKLEAGRWRTYYCLTPSGRQALTHIRAKLAELSAEVLSE